MPGVRGVPAAAVGLTGKLLVAEARIDDRHHAVHDRCGAGEDVGVVVELVVPERYGEVRPLLEVAARDVAPRGPAVAARPQVVLKNAAPSV